MKVGGDEVDVVDVAIAQVADEGGEVGDGVLSIVGRTQLHN
ncbi:MAG: hypothetical protein ACFE0I_15935 [Elainellaceae cyanobacterium]